MLTQRFVPLLVTSAVLIVLSVFFEGSVKTYTYAEWPTLASAVVVALSSCFVFLDFRQSSQKNLSIAGIVAAVLPFLLSFVLDRVSGGPNVHGIAIARLFFFALISELSALGIFITVAVRALRHRKNAT
jgi:hypothetical protein